MADSSMRDDFESAIAEVEELEEDTQENEEIEGLHEGEETAEAETETQEDVEAYGAEDSEPTEPEERNNDSVAPAGWTPAEREEWSALPDSVKNRVTLREQQMNDFMNEGADNRKLGQRYKELTDRFSSVFAAEGMNDSFAGIEGLIGVVAGLQNGAPLHKAQTIANFVKQYGVDIGELDNALSGAQPSAQTQQNTQFEQMIDSRMQPVNQLLEQINQNNYNNAQQREQQTTQDIQQFEQTAEFMGDVRNDMADLMDMAASRGQSMSLQQAYDKACAIHPEISQVMSDRQANATLMSSNNNLTNKMNASNGISGDQGGSGGGNGDMSLRQMIEQGFN